jgi:hypothetical protein
MKTRNYEPLVFGLILSGLQAWMTSWLLAFPAVLLAAPMARRMARLVIEYFTAPETDV